MFRETSVYFTKHTIVSRCFTKNNKKTCCLVKHTCLRRCPMYVSRNIQHDNVCFTKHSMSKKGYCMFCETYRFIMKPGKKLHILKPSFPNTITSQTKTQTQNSPAKLLLFFSKKLKMEPNLCSERSLQPACGKRSCKTVQLFYNNNSFYNALYSYISLARPDRLQLCVFWRQYR